MCLNGLCVLGPKHSAWYPIGAYVVLVIKLVNR